MAFASSTRGTQKASEGDKASKDGDVLGRFANLRGRNGDTTTARRRGESSELDTEGWSTVKPRKSFGTEGAERFQGRMGGTFRHDKKPSRDKDDPTLRPFDALSGLSKGREGEDEGRPRNGSARNKVDPWRDTAVEEAPTSATEKRERMDRAKSWRERDITVDTNDDHTTTRAPDRRWGRETNQRVEREPEWLDEPAEAKPEARTQQDFQKWMEEMKKAKGGQSAAAKPAAAAPEPVAEGPRPIRSPPGLEAGPDKFFMAFGGKTGPDVATPGEQPDTANKSKQTGKSSRFTSFFQHQDEGRAKVESPNPLASLLLNGGSGVPPAAAPVAPAIAMALPHPSSAAPDEEKQAFQQLLAKLQKQSVSATPPGPSPFPLPTQNNAPEVSRSAVTSASPFQQMQADRRDGPVGRPPPQYLQEILAPRPQQQNARPEQLLQDLVGHHQRVSSQGSARADPSAPRNNNNNSNTEFLMNLMRSGSDSQRSESAMMRLAQQAQKQGQMPQTGDRDADYGRDSRGPLRQMRPPPPPGFGAMEEAFHVDGEPRTNQPTQILQRPPPPPGLEQQMPPGWLQGGGPMQPPPQQPPQSQPPQQRGPMIPPPGLAAGPGRNPPMPHMFAPNFPPGGIPPPEVLSNMPPRNMGPPPPGFFNNIPQGFMPPGLGGFNGPPGPEAHAGFPASPYETRGMPPSANGRGTNFGRN
jgi:hypothetical protein